MARANETRLERFLRENDLSLGRFARAADLADSHFAEIRSGNVEPRRDTLEKMRRAASILLNRHVTISELFDFGEDVTTARERRGR